MSERIERGLRALELLSGTLPQHGCGERVHLDLGCGCAPLAERIEADLGLHYVGIAFDGWQTGGSMASPAGLEIHRVAVDPQSDLLRQQVDQALRGRRVASIALVDVLDRIPWQSLLLEHVRELAGHHDAVVLLSVPNAAHWRQGLQLALSPDRAVGAGLADPSVLQYFTRPALHALLARHGFEPPVHRDLLQPSLEPSPARHPALAEATPTSILLRGLRAGVDDADQTLTFVAATRPIGAAADRRADLPRRWPIPSAAPFLSIVTRTQGRRPAALRDLLLALAAQSCDDFELILVGHKLSAEEGRVVDGIVGETPDPLRQRIHLLRLDSGNRTAPLNFGFAAARGEYVTILDDDDLLFAHWVETFRDMARRAPGRLLRSVAVRQEYDCVDMPHGSLLPRATGVFLRDYPSEFNLLEHLRDNNTPGLAIAFPVALFRDLGLRFDETLTTAEDWDFIMRAVAICGVESSRQITSIYRWWKSSESSRSVHAREEWHANHRRIFAKMDSRPFLTPPGTARQLRALLDYRDALERQRAELTQRLGLPQH